MQSSSIPFDPRADYSFGGMRGQCSAEYSGSLPSLRNNGASAYAGWRIRMSDAFKLCGVMPLGVNRRMG